VCVVCVCVSVHACVCAYVLLCVCVRVRACVVLCFLVVVCCARGGGGEPGEYDCHFTFDSSRCHPKRRA